jgi:hypothetical protein
MKQKNNVHTFQQTEMIELTESETNSVTGGRWVEGPIYWCIRDITCRDSIWVY